MIELPEGWCFAGLAELGIARMGPTILAKELSAAGTPVYSAGQENTRWGFTEKDVPVFDAGTLVISARGTIGFPKIPADTVFTSTQTTILVRPLASIESRYFCYFLKKIDWKEVASGAAIPMLTISMLGELQFQLAPLPEQKRIADKLDALLARVDAARARLDRIPGVLKQFRQSVLAAATSGELTEEWRGLRSRETAQALFDALLKDHEDVGGHKRGNASDPTEDAHDLSQDTIPMEWRVVTMKDVCAPGRPITYGILKPGPELDEGVPYVRVADFPGNKLSLANIKKTSSEMDEQFRRSRLNSGDLLLSIRGSVGRLVEIPEALSGANITQDTARLSISGRLCARYVYFALLSEDVQRRMRLSTRGVAVRGINIGDVRALQIPLPPLPEQTEIVRRVETLFALADKVQAQYSTARARIDKLTAAILAKAFRGELVPQDPNDEPASVLLARLRAQRDAAPAPTRRGRKPAAKH